MPRLYKGSKSILKVTPFDLAWVDGGSEGPVVVCSSGGGSVKSGMKNQIQVVVPPKINQAEDFSSYKLHRGFETDSEEDDVKGICSAISTGVLSDGTAVVCTLVNNKAVLTKAYSTPDAVREANRKEEAQATGKKKRDYLQEALSFDKIAAFQADFEKKTDLKEEEEKNTSAGTSAVNSCCFVSASTVECDENDGVCVRKTTDLLLTGGNDGVVRVWEIKKDAATVATGSDEASISNAGSKYSVKLCKELGKAHKESPVSILRTYDNPHVKRSNPMQAYVCSGHKNGDVRVWDMSAVLSSGASSSGSSSGSGTGLLVNVFPMGWDVLSGLSGAGSAAAAAKGGSGTIEIRGCAFGTGSDDPSIHLEGLDDASNTSASIQARRSDVGCYLYTLQKECKRGPSFLIKWELVAGQEEQEKQIGASTEGVPGASTAGPFSLQAIPICATLVSAQPCTRLDVSDCGMFVGVGCSDGSCAVYGTMSDGKPLSKLHSFMCHELSVTGMRFAPGVVASAANVPALLVSCGPDNHVCVMPVGGSSTLMAMCAQFLFLIIIVLLCVISLSLLGGEMFGSIAIL